MLIQEKILLKSTLVISLLGMLLLIALSSQLPKENTETMLISSLEETPQGTQVTIAGAITAIQNTPSMLIMTIQDASGSVKVVADKKGMETKLKIKTKIEVSGMLKEYQEKQEIQASIIKILEKSK